MLFLYLYRVFKCMELLSFNSSAETDVVKRFPTILCPPCPGIEPEISRTANTLSSSLYIYIYIIC